MQKSVLLLALVCVCSATVEAECRSLPEARDVFTVEVLRHSGNKFDPEFQFDKESFLNAYPRFELGMVKHPDGLDLAWQNGVIVTLDKRVLFWRTCDRRFGSVSV